jgi:hypothetical protein
MRVIEAPVSREPGSAARQAPLKQGPIQTPRQALFSCPKCRVTNPKGATDCRSCGIVFAKYKPEDERARTLDDLQLAGRPEFIELWKRVIEEYENLEAHENFLEACRASGSLVFAAHMYGRVLEIVPHEQTAQRMRRRIVGLAAINFVKGPTGRWRFRVPGFVDLAIVMSSAVLTAGLMLGNMHNLIGIGGAMLALTIGVRFFLRPFT